jgi:hypothetical protein
MGAGRHLAQRQPLADRQYLAGRQLGGAQLEDLDPGRVPGAPRRAGVPDPQVDQHLLRLSDNTRQSIETSSLHLDLLADFKRINSLFCSVAYPILESAGVLSKTRVLPASAGNGAGSTTPRHGAPAH